MNKRSSPLVNKEQNNKIVSNKKREAIQRAKDLLNFKVDYTKTTIYRKKEVEQIQISGEFAEGNNKINKWPAHLDEDMFEDKKVSSKENEVTKEKKDRQDNEEKRKESKKGGTKSSKSNNEKIVTKQLIAVTDNKIGFSLFLKDSEKKIMTMQFCQGSPQALNGELLKKIMRAVESYIREVQKNQEEG